MANNGRIIVIGSRGEVTINPRELMGRRASIRGFTLWGITPTEEADIHAGIFAGLENGTLRPVKLWPSWPPGSITEHGPTGRYIIADRGS